MTTPRIPKIHFPWRGLKKGEGFFVPALDIETTTTYGERSALHFKASMKTLIGVKDGKFGILFIRTR